MPGGLHAVAVVALLGVGVPAATLLLARLAGDGAGRDGRGGVGIGPAGLDLRLPAFGALLQLVLVDAVVVAAVVVVAAYGDLNHRTAPVKLLILAGLAAVAVVHARRRGAPG